jgi:hypothetical protein
MAQVTDVVLKSYFETGDVPTQAQYIDTIDSKRNIQDTILQSEVEKGAPLTSAISGSGTVVVAANSMIKYIVLLPSGGGTYKIGSTAGGTEYDTGTLIGTTPFTLTWGQYVTASTTIYFTGTFTAKIFVA